VRTLSDGTKIPGIGLGTFGSDKYGSDAVSEAVYGAIKSGYRLIDCASVYMNEDEIGKVLKRLFDEGAVKREDLFITSKVWNDQHAHVEESCKKSICRSGLENVDLYFLHWPFPNYHAPHCDGDSTQPGFETVLGR
jgi:diketogulonate reductase-like aldo/keto reductase